MELEVIEAVVEKIWDLHDKLSDAIHSISRTHFLNSINKSDDLLLFSQRTSSDHSGHNHRTGGQVFAKDLRVDEDYSAIQEAKSLNAIRTALENLEDQLQFFHTVQRQQRAERDAAVAHLEQSRIVLAMRLAEHQGKKYNVIEEARAFAGDVRDAGHFGSSENLYTSAGYPSAENYVRQEGWRSSFLVKVLISSFNFAKGSLKVENMGGILGNAALVALSMLALLHRHLHQVAVEDKYVLDFPHRKDVVDSREVTKVSRPKGSSPSGGPTLLDVLLARG